MRVRTWWMYGAILVLVLVLGLGGGARADRDHDAARSLTGKGAILPLETILETVRNQVSGRVLEVELEERRGVYLYELELLDEEGRVWELEIDATTGRMVERKLED